MLSYTYQVQMYSRGKWSPYYPYGSSSPANFLSLDDAEECLLLLHVKHSQCRIVKIEIYDIKTLS